MLAGRGGLLVVLEEGGTVNCVEGNGVAVPNCASGTWKVRMSWFCFAAKVVPFGLPLLRLSFPVIPRPLFFWFVTAVHSSAESSTVDTWLARKSIGSPKLVLILLGSGCVHWATTCSGIEKIGAAGAVRLSALNGIRSLVGRCSYAAFALATAS